MPDKRLIDANALMKNIGKIPQLRGITYGRMKKAVEETPTIDAVSVVHGRWILQRIYRKCSLCEWIFCIRDEGNGHLRVSPLLQITVHEKNIKYVKFVSDREKCDKIQAFLVKVSQG